MLLPPGTLHVSVLLLLLLLLRPPRLIHGAQEFNGTWFRK
jgi:hypothetical protein